MMRFLIYFALLFAWQIGTKFEILPHNLLPSPLEIIHAAIDNFAEIFINSLSTIKIALAGIFLASIFAVILAIFMRIFTFLENFFTPIFIFLQNIPTIALAPILLLWFGFGDFSKLNLVFLSCFYPILLSLFASLKNADTEIINLLKTMNASKWQILYFYTLPHSLKGLFTGLKVAISYAFLSTTTAECLGGLSGLGVMMVQAKKLYEYDLMFAVIFIISMLSIIFTKLLFLLEKFIHKGQK